MMRHWIDLLEMATPITQRYIDTALERMEHLPAEIIVSLNNRDLHGFAPLPNMVEIAHIEVPEDLQGQGYASQALTILTKLADDMGVTLVLTVAESADESDWPMASDELHNWYERYGFEGVRKMIRSPRAAT